MNSFGHCPLTLDDLSTVQAVVAFAAPGVPLMVSKRSRKPGRVLARRTLLENVGKAQGNPRALESVCAAVGMQNAAQWPEEAERTAQEFAALTLDSCGQLIVPKAHGRGLKRHVLEPAYLGDNWRALIDGERMPRPRPTGGPSPSSSYDPDDWGD